MRIALSLLALCPLAAAQSILDAGGAPDVGHPGLYAWYDAATGINGAGTPTDGAQVTSWVDRSGNGRGLVRTSANPVEQPVFRAASMNGYPALEFDGNDYIWADLQTQFGTVTSGSTVFWVSRVDAADGGYVFDGTGAAVRRAVFAGQSTSPARWVLYTGNDPVTVGPFVDLNVAQVHSAVFDASSNEHFLNGASIASGTSPLANHGGFIVGARYSLSQFLSGSVAEILVYDQVLSDTDRQAVEGYLLAKHPIADPRPMPDFVDVFTSGDGSYPTYRIPSILTTRAGSLLAFAEGRASTSDHAQNDIVLRRSIDGGNTWGAVTVLHDDGANSLNNPCVVEVREGPHEGRILLMYQRYPNGCHESCVVAGYVGPMVCRSFLMHSDDDGVTWSTPLEVTTQVKRPTVATSIASGPGVGIQKRRAPNAGRIVMPFNQGPNPNWKVYAVYSDDGGDTWTWGDLADDSMTPGTANEVQMVELEDGSLLLNSRSAGGTSHRKIAWSYDGGLTWTPLEDELELIEPRVMASTLRYTDPLDGFAQGRLLYAGPFSQTSRVMGTVHLSLDDGGTWPTSRLLYPGGYAYSVLTVLPDASIGVLFERDGTAHISLARVPLAWLTDGQDAALPGPNASSFCATSPNSAGMGAQIGAAGTASVSTNDLVLLATGAPAGEPGLFYYGPDPIQVPFGDGLRCVGGQGSGSLVRIFPIVQSDVLGGLSIGVDSSLSQHAMRLVPGSTWYFQAWFRDPAAGGAGFNLSDGLALTLAP